MGNQWTISYGKYSSKFALAFTTYMERMFCIEISRHLTSSQVKIRKRKQGIQEQHLNFNLYKMKKAKKKGELNYIKLMRKYMRNSCRVQVPGKRLAHLTTLLLRYGRTNKRQKNLIYGLLELFCTSYALVSIRIKRIALKNYNKRY